jgi:hypothetical protein
VYFELTADGEVALNDSLRAIASLRKGLKLRGSG